MDYIQTGNGDTYKYKNLIFKAKSCVSHLSPIALHALITMLERVGVNIGLRHSEVYNNVQGLQEIEDDNSLLTMAINTFGFDQDQAEVKAL